MPLHRSFYILHMHVLANKKFMYLKKFWTGVVLVFALILHPFLLPKQTEASKSKKNDSKFSPKTKTKTKQVQILFRYSSLKTVGICTLWRGKWTSDLQLSAFSTWNSLNILSSYNDACTKDATLPTTDTHVNIKLREQILKITRTE